ncbi:MAG: Smr/MutS family protein [Bacilli bacterium]|nr:Smr/MutS family protein [Bacilli bacterium]
MNKIIRDPFTINLPHLDIHGETSATAVAVINGFIRDNLKLKNKKIIIVHGKGAGILKKTTHELCKNNKNIEKYYIDGLNDGQTIIELKI